MVHITNTLLVALVAAGSASAHRRFERRHGHEKHAALHEQQHKRDVMGTGTGVPYPAPGNLTAGPTGTAVTELTT